MGKKRGGKRTQISIEYITIFGFVFLMIVPLIIIYYDQTQHVQESIAINQIYNIAREIADKAEQIYYSGEPSKTTIQAYFPERIESITINGSIIQFNYLRYNNYVQSIIGYANVNLTGNLSSSSGIHYIEIEAQLKGVKISER